MSDAKLIEQLSQTKTRLHLFKSISTHITSGSSVEQIIERTLCEAHKSFPQLRISYSMMDRVDQLKVIFSIGPEGRGNLTGMEFDLSGNKGTWEKLRSGGMLIVPEIEKEDSFKVVAGVAVEAGAQSFVLLPVKHSEEVMGLICFDSDRPREWSDHEISTLSDMAEYLAIAIRDANATQERKRIELHLRESQKMEAVGRLVGGIAHDFNNLLTAMMIYTGLLATSLGKENRLYRHVDEIRQAGERGAALVAQLIALTRQQVLEPKVTSINSVIRELQDLLQRMIGEDIVMSTALAEELRNTKVDPVQMQQVILNLAINARDAMPQGGKLLIKTANVIVNDEFAKQNPGFDPGEYVVLTVTDTGCGMDTETKTHIFEPFFTTKERGKGSGLGLATAYGIVKQHKGYIAVESVLNRGTTFRIFLPIEGPERELLQERKAEPKACDSKETLLLVEDEDIVRRSLVEILTLGGFQVLSAANGAEALQVYQDCRQHIHMMITDLVMPGMNGRELAHRMSGLRPGMPVLYISGYTDDPRTRQLLGEGADFCRKPFSPVVLQRKIREILDRGSMAKGQPQSD